MRKKNKSAELKSKLKRIKVLEKELAVLTAILIFGWLLYELGFYEQSKR